jgi:GAF domain-containing protein
MAIQDLGIVACAGAPLVTTDGYALGSLCVIDTKLREWTESDLTILCELAAIAMREIELPRRH